MPKQYISTRTRIQNASYPVLIVIWGKDDDGNGWTGEAQEWKDGNTKTGEVHSINLRQGMPLGSISVAVDEVSHGAWAYGAFEGAGLTERDLQWAALFAVQALKRKQALFD